MMQLEMWIMIRITKKLFIKVGDIFRKLEENFEEDSINIAVSHLFVSGWRSI